MTAKPTVTLSPAEALVEYTLRQLADLQTPYSADLEPEVQAPRYDDTKNLKAKAGEFVDMLNLPTKVVTFSAGLPDKKQQLTFKQLIAAEIARRLGA